MKRKRKTLQPGKRLWRVQFIAICCFMTFWPVFGVVSKTPVSSQNPLKIGDRIPELKTIGGRVWNSVTIVRIEPDCVTISTENGLARVPLESVDDGLQTRFCYDRSKAVQYRKEREEAERKQIEEWSNRKSQSTQSPAVEPRLAEADAMGRKRAEARQQIDEKSRATLQELHSKRIAEENEAAMRRAEAAEKTKARIAEREKKKKEKKK